MNTEKKRYKIEIFGNEYTIISDEQEGHIVRSAEMVDTLMKQIVEGSQNIDVQKVAVLVALRMANDVLNLQKKLESVEKQQEQLSKDIDKELLSLSS